MQIWALAEIAAFVLTSLTPENKRFWRWDDTGYYTNHNYQCIVPLQIKPQKAFVDRENFDGYIREGMKAIKNQQKGNRFLLTGPCVCHLTVPDNLMNLIT